MYMITQDVFRKIGEYIKHETAPEDVPIVLGWWNNCGPVALNEMEFSLDAFSEGSRRDELYCLKTAILLDQHTDPNEEGTGRILQMIDTFIKELEDDIEYETIEDLRKAGEDF